ncbi:hypothetical protein [Amycolatopsis palatopharyngis]|uniref:hypothetical protein n=1 Tax=Amycolatopsis palatopharyngis TaxID=187982 RepID=UPI000E26F4BB|nr:hypothetical protein [Amycolatopsis palatopharyngis]
MTSVPEKTWAIGERVTGTEVLSGATRTGPFAGLHSTFPGHPPDNAWIADESNPQGWKFLLELASLKVTPAQGGDDHG